MINDVSFIAIKTMNLEISIKLQTPVSEKVPHHSDRLFTNWQCATYMDVGSAEKCLEHFLSTLAGGKSGNLRNAVPLRFSMSQG